MLAKHNLIVIFMTLSVKYSVYASDYFNNLEDVHEGSSCEDKISAALSVMKNETNHKLDDMDKRILEKLNEATKTQMDTLEKILPERLEKHIENNFSLLEKKNRAMQEEMHERFHKLEKNLVDKLEEYVVEKLNLIEKHMNRRIDILENSIPDKADTNIIIRKLDVLKKMQLDSDSGAICKMANKTSTFLEEDINTKLYTIEKTILDLENTTTNTNIDAVDKNLTNLAENLNQKWTEIKKMVPDMEENISRKLDSLGNKIPEHLEHNVNLKLETMEKKIININETIQYKLDSLDKKFEQTIDRKLGEIQKKIPQLENNINGSMTELQNLENNILAEVTEIQYTLGCKEQRVKDNYYIVPYFRMDNETLKHVTYRNDSSGSTTFEMHLAVKGKDIVAILLSTRAKFHDHHDFQIGMVQQDTILYQMGKRVAEHKSFNTMSASKFTAIYLKVTNGTLEMGKEGSSSPLVSYSDATLKSVKYFSFASNVGGEMTFLYDCPSHVFQLISNEY